MEMKHIVWGMAGITGLMALIVIGIAMGAVFNPDAPPAPGVPGGAPTSAQERVLQGFDVVLWGEGRPFVRMLEPVTGESDTVNLVTYLMFEPEHAESGYMDEGGYGMKQPNPVSVENTYRLGLVYEHGLFGVPQNTSEALRCYNIAWKAGHADAEAAAHRLGRK
jgi:hypothetical protein